MPTSRPDTAPRPEAIANTVRFTASTSTPICCAASRSCADARDHQVERADRAPADLEADLEQRARHRARIGREEELHQLVEHEADADGRQQRRDVRVALQGPQAEALDHQAEQSADHQHDGDRHRQRRAEMRHRQEAGIGAHDIDRTMREIDQPAHPEDQGEADRQQRIDVADDDAVDGVVDPGRQESEIRVQRAAALGSLSWNLPSLTTSSTFIAPSTRRVLGSNVALPKMMLGTSFTLARPSWIDLRSVPNSRITLAITMIVS